MKKSRYLNQGLQKDNPLLLDKALQDMQNHLKATLPWLNTVFGRAYRLVEHKSDGEKFIYPAAYIGNSEYVALLPDDNFGNFVWFDIYDPQIVDRITPRSPQYTFMGAAVFWYNITSIYSDNSFMYTEEVKSEILKAFTSPGIFQSPGRIEVRELYERFENIYKGYSVEKVYDDFVYKGKNIQGIDKQYFMHPYAGLRVEFTLNIRELC